MQLFGFGFGSSATVEKIRSEFDASFHLSKSEDSCKISLRSATARASRPKIQQNFTAGNFAICPNDITYAKIPSIYTPKTLATRWP